MMSSPVTTSLLTSAAAAEAVDDLAFDVFVIIAGVDVGVSFASEFIGGVDVGGGGVGVSLALAFLGGVDVFGIIGGAAGGGGSGNCPGNIGIRCAGGGAGNCPGNGVDGFGNIGVRGGGGGGGAAAICVLY